MHRRALPSMGIVSAVHEASLFFGSRGGGLSLAAAIVEGLFASFVLPLLRFLNLRRWRVYPLPSEPMSRAELSWRFDATNPWVISAEVARFPERTADLCDLIVPSVVARMVG